MDLCCRIVTTSGSPAGLAFQCSLFLYPFVSSALRAVWPGMKHRWRVNNIYVWVWGLGKWGIGLICFTKPFSYDVSFRLNCFFYPSRRWEAYVFFVLNIFFFLPFVSFHFHNLIRGIPTVPSYPQWLFFNNHPSLPYLLPTGLDLVSLASLHCGAVGAN